MARPRMVSLRRLRRSERKTVEAKVRDKKLSTRIHQRYRIIAEASHEEDQLVIAQRVGVHVTTVYNWIHRFNTIGLEGIEDPPNPAGRPSSLSGRQIRLLIKIALSRPSDLGLPFTQWSVAKLREYCRQRNLLPEYSDEWVRRLLRREGVSFQRTKTWKESPDPQFEVKKTGS
jgi:transposase